MKSANLATFVGVYAAIGGPFFIVLASLLWPQMNSFGKQQP